MLGQPLVLQSFGRDPTAFERFHHEHTSLDWLIGYWEAVEQNTLRRWPALMEIAVENRRVPLDPDQPVEGITADEVLWHVMQHEVRHTPHVVQMIRLLGHKPPALDLVFISAEPLGDVTP